MVVTLVLTLAHSHLVGAYHIAGLEDCSVYGRYSSSNQFQHAEADMKHVGNSNSSGVKCSSPCAIVGLIPVAARQTPPLTSAASALAGPSLQSPVARCTAGWQAARREMLEMHRFIHVAMRSACSAVTPRITCYLVHCSATHLQADLRRGVGCAHDGLDVRGLHRHLRCQQSCGGKASHCQLHTAWGGGLYAFALVHLSTPHVHCGQK